VSRILITGASGFVGRALTIALSPHHRIRAAARNPAQVPTGPNIEAVALPDLAASCDFGSLLGGIDAIVHLAGIAHIGPGVSAARYDRVNHLATAELAQAAARAGVGRFIFASSIRAQSGAAADHVLSETDTPHPTDAYGRSKLAAEAAVRGAGVAFTILRPVLIYGADAKGNLASLLRLAALPVPLPFGGFANRRSLIALDNLIEAIRFVLATPKTAGETYIVADPLPAPAFGEIIAMLRAAQGRPSMLFPVPAALFRWPLAAIGRSDVWDRLGGELIANPKKLIAAGWHPPLSTQAGLIAMAQAASPRKSGTASRITR
jgi:UDP-glucose 4-epimerase